MIIVEFITAAVLSLGLDIAAVLGTLVLLAAIMWLWEFIQRIFRWMSADRSR